MMASDWSGFSDAELKRLQGNGGTAAPKERPAGSSLFGYGPMHVNPSK